MPNVPTKDFIIGPFGPNYLDRVKARVTGANAITKGDLAVVSHLNFGVGPRPSPRSAECQRATATTKGMLMLASTDAQVGDSVVLVRYLPFQLNTSAGAIGDPVYMGAAGEPTLTPGTAAAQNRAIVTASAGVTLAAGASDTLGWDTIDNQGAGITLAASQITLQPTGKRYRVRASLSLAGSVAGLDRFGFRLVGGGAVAGAHQVRDAVLITATDAGHQGAQPVALLEVTPTAPLTIVVRQLDASAVTQSLVGAESWIEIEEIPEALEAGGSSGVTGRVVDVGTVANGGSVILASPGLV